MNDRPGYWMNETTGVLVPAVHAYLRGGPMAPEQISAMRAYLRQWIFAPAWEHARMTETEREILNELRDAIDKLQTRAAIDLWLYDADALGIDPL